MGEAILGVMIFLFGFALGGVAFERPVTGDSYETCNINKQSGEVCELNVEYVARKVEDKL